MILELHPSPARDIASPATASQATSSKATSSQATATPTAAELEQELRALRQQVDELAEEMHARRAPAARRRIPRRAGRALRQGSGDLRERHEEQVLEHLLQAGLHRLG